MKKAKYKDFEELKLQNEMRHERNLLKRGKEKDNRALCENKMERVFEKVQERKSCLATQAGITLVALVVTIVVLLILAGITITYLFSDNGILSRAQDASYETDVATVLEELQTRLLTVQMNNMGTYTIDHVWKVVDDVLGEDAERDTENYTVQTEKGNTVDISSLIYGASDYAADPNVASIVLTADTSYAYGYANITVSVEVEDDDGISSYEYCLAGESKNVNNTENTSDSYTYDYLDFGETYSVEVIVTDKLGNTTVKTKDVTATKLISFTLITYASTYSDVTYYAPEGMTWSEWFRDETSYGSGGSGCEASSLYDIYFDFSLVVGYYNGASSALDRSFDSEEEANACATYLSSLDPYSYWPASEGITTSSEIVDGFTGAWDAWEFDYDPYVYYDGEVWVCTGNCASALVLIDY